jgi:ataxin-3
MKEEQEYAQREVWSGADLTPEEHIALQTRREQRQREEQEEAEDMRRAIEKSKALAQLEVDEDIEIDDENHDMDAESSYTHKSFVHGNRVYDDDDAELQAALKASLEHMPPNLPSQLSKSSSDADDVESIVSDTTSAAEEPTSNVTPAVSLDEIRRRRLARFEVQS